MIENIFHALLIWKIVLIIFLNKLKVFLSQSAMKCSVKGCIQGDFLFANDVFV